MKIHIDIRNDISPTIALECVKQVIIQGKVSASGKSYCYATTFEALAALSLICFPLFHYLCSYGSIDGIAVILMLCISCFTGFS